MSLGALFKQITDEFSKNLKDEFEYLLTQEGYICGISHELFEKPVYIKGRAVDKDKIRTAFDEAAIKEWFEDHDTHPYESDTVLSGDEKTLIPAPNVILNMTAFLRPYLMLAELIENIKSNPFQNAWFISIPEEGLNKALSWLKKQGFIANHDAKLTAIFIRFPEQTPGESFALIAAREILSMQRVALAFTPLINAIKNDSPTAVSWEITIPHAAPLVVASWYESNKFAVKLAGCGKYKVTLPENKMEVDEASYLGRAIAARDERTSLLKIKKESGTEARELTLLNTLYPRIVEEMQKNESARAWQISFGPATELDFACKWLKEATGLEACNLLWGISFWRPIDQVCEQQLVPGQSVGQSSSSSAVSSSCSVLHSYEQARGSNQQSSSTHSIIPAQLEWAMKPIPSPEPRVMPDKALIRPDLLRGIHPNRKNLYRN